MIKYMWQCIGVFCVMHATALAQAPCTHPFKGHIYDAETQKPIAGALVFFAEQSVPSKSTQDGYFELRHLCEGEQSIRVECPGYKLFQSGYSLPLTNSINLYLQPLSANLHTVTISSQRNDALVEPNRKLTAEQLFLTKGQTLGKALELLPGVYNLSTGQSISKPIVHGLHSNRVLLVNNEIRQESQQWGSEHAPEVDAYQANELQLITGPRCLRYGSDALGGVILMQAAPLGGVTSAHWVVNTGLFSNGRGGTMSLMGESPWKKHQAWVGRMQGSIRRSGNLTSPDYVLNNTGFYERSLALGLAYKKNKWLMQWHLSDFYTRLGILSSSHIGNLSDLYAAFQRERPLDTAQFTYHIGFPYQQLHHQIIQWQGEYKLSDKQKFEWQYAFQRNRRKEFDKTLQSMQGGDVIKPALDFNLMTHQFDVRWIRHVSNGNTRQIGLTSQIQTNEYYASYLIPNYVRYQNGIFAIGQFSKNKITAEYAIRYDVQSLQVVRWENAQLTQPRFLFYGPAFMAGLKVAQNKGNLYIYGGTTWRAPHVNEMYSYGIHHSAATFEMGDSTLKPERNYQLNVSVNRGHSNQYHCSATLYGQYIDRFIYLKPVFPAVLTIKGAFPAFKYTPIQLYMGGLDVLLESPRQRQWLWHVKSAVLVARDRATGFAPVGMPPARLEGALAYRISRLSHDPISVFTGINYTFQAMGLAQGSDYLKPPKAFWLCKAGVETGFHWQELKGRIAIGIDNILNVRYRDYLNRYRYFVNEPGRNMFVQCTIERH